MFTQLALSKISQKIKDLNLRGPISQKMKAEILIQVLTPFEKDLKFLKSANSNKVALKFTICFKLKKKTQVISMKLLKNKTIRGRIVRIVPRFRFQNLT